MLDQDLKEQLKSLFENLEHTIEFSYSKCEQTDQSQLIEMLSSVAETSHKIVLKESSELASYPQFKILKDGSETGIRFNGIPNGHEFSSLILAVLNADGKGRMPDDGLTARIKNLKGPIEIKTYISLTCENCPNVVQVLNQMALLHPAFKHTMIDGAYVQDEISRLGIQGVPSVMVNEKLIHSGKISLIDLIAKLESVFGSNSKVDLEKDLGQFDVVVVGGGPAGASAAIYSARKGLKTAIIAEKVGGQVQDTKGIENLISVLYTEGPQLAAQLHQHIQSYQIKLLEHRRVIKISKDAIKKIDLEGGEFLNAKSVIIATGAKWRELGIPGEKEYIGRGVAFCPHCDGPYYKGKKVAVIGGGNSGVEAAIDLAGIVHEVVLIEFGSQLKADRVLVEKLNSLQNATIILNARSSQIIGDGQKVNALEYEDRSDQSIKMINLDGVFVQIGLLPNTQFLKDTVELTKMGEIVVDQKGRTSEQGIYAAGDVTTTPYKQIIIAMGEGAKVALASFEDSMYTSQH
jgi:alkyl hydroperoxide reductase subunit F